MIFCSLLAYELNSAQRFAAERCLWKLFCQLGDNDSLLIFEKPFGERVEAWRMKPKVFGLALAAAKKDEFACFVDSDIEFRDGFVKALKSFLSNIVDKNKPTICVTKIWERGGRNWISDERIVDYFNRSMLGGTISRMWDFYFGTGLIVANKAFLAYIDEWQLLTNQSQWYPEETALVSLAHKYQDKWRIVWIPEEIHWVGWKLRGVNENAYAIHIGGDHIDKWLEVTFNADSQTR